MRALYGLTNPPVSDAAPSEPAIRPWGLCGMRPASQQGDPVREVFAYDHDRQLAVDKQGRLLVNAALFNEPVARLFGPPYGVGAVAHAEQGGVRRHWEGQVIAMAADRARDFLARIGSVAWRASCPARSTIGGAAG
jgi:hypothetical protein